MDRRKLLDPQTLGYALLSRGNAELSRLGRVRGAYRSTERRTLRALALLALGSALVGSPLATRAEAQETPSFSSAFPFGIDDVGGGASPDSQSSGSSG